MSLDFTAATRSEQGTGASRRLRRAGKLPGIIYGADQEAVPVTLDHNQLYHLMRREVFHSSVLNVTLDGKKQQVILRDSQWHPFKQQVLHVDFQRISAKEKITIRVPLRFEGAEESPAVKLSDAMISNVITEVEVICLPKNLPAFIEVDLSKLEEGQSVYLSELVIPEGVEFYGYQDEDPVIATVLKTGGEEEEDELDEDAQVDGEAGEGAEGADGDEAAE